MPTIETNAAQEELTRKSALELSELLLINPALGAGISRPEGFLATPYWTSTCGIHPAIHQAFIRAEHLLAADERVMLKAERKQLKELEKQLKEREGKTKESKVADTIRFAIPGAGGPVTDYADAEESTDDLRDRIDALKAKISSHTDVVWYESGTNKATLIEVLANSRYHATSFVDELGSSLGLYFACPVKFAADLSWLDLNKEHERDISLIRSSATGGANINKLGRLGHKVSFHWLVSANRASIRSLGELITTRASARKALGSTVLLDEQHDNCAMHGELVHEETWKRLIDEFYRSPDNPYRVTFQSEVIAGAWQLFTNAGVYELIDKQDLDWYDEEDTMLVCSPQALTTAVLQATVNRSILRHLNTGTLPASREIVLTGEDLSWAWKTARNVFPVILGFDKTFARARRARRLAYDRFQITPERLDAAYHAVFAAMQSAGGVLAHSKAVRLPDVTAKLLEAMVNRGKLRLLLRDRPEDVEAMTEGRGVGRIPERAYMAASVLQMHPEEAKAELESALASPDLIPEIDTIGKFVELRDMAEAAKIRAKRLLPALPITELKSEQIAAIPAILAMYPDEVQLRGTPDNPEHPTFTNNEGGDAQLPENTPVLWFRWDRRGKPLMPWQYISIVKWPGAADATKLVFTHTDEPSKPHLALLGIA